MTMDEACLILNVKKDTPLEQVTKVSLVGRGDNGIGY